MGSSSKGIREKIDSMVLQLCNIWKKTVKKLMYIIILEIINKGNIITDNSIDSESYRYPSQVAQDVSCIKYILFVHNMQVY